MPPRANRCASLQTSGLKVERAAVKGNASDGSGPKVLAAFAGEPDLSRIDKYVDKLRESLKDTNARFVQFKATCLLLLLAYHLVLYGGNKEISFLGIKVTDVDVITRWFLVLPALAFCVSCCYGYLRVYQQETIAWIMARFHPQEFEAGIYRLILPSTYILGLDVMRREGSTMTQLIASIPSAIFVLGSLYLPPVYTFFAYRKSFEHIGLEFELVASAVVSALLYLASFLIINRSQKI
jgi:hypothetical protein